MQQEMRERWPHRFSVALDKAESVYLRVLRALILIIATLMIGYAIWLALSSVYKISRSPDSVTEETATVSADEITNAQLPERAASRPRGDAEPTATPQQRAYFASFIKRYHTLYLTKFEPFRQAEDKTLSRDEFDDSFIGSQGRLKRIAKGELSFESQKADLEGLLGIMREAADKPMTRQRLQRYKTAKKVRVERKVERIRTETRDGWDSYSTGCVNWYQSPIGCPVRRLVEIPYTETVASLEFPKGTQAHIEIFRALQERYIQLLSQRRKANAEKAERERQGILAGKAEGELSLFTALQVVGAFLALMFFFLLIAIERHQRRMARAQHPEQAADTVPS